MKRIVAGVLMSLFLFQTLEVAYIYVHFKINQDKITQLLCINKDKPELKCMGCCQLKKELAQHEKREQQSHRLIQQEKMTFFVIGFLDLLHACYPVFKKDYTRNLVSELPQSLIIDVFHPPKSDFL